MFTVSGENAVKCLKGSFDIFDNGWTFSLVFGNLRQSLTYVIKFLRQYGKKLVRELGEIQLEELNVYLGEFIIAAREKKEEQSSLRGNKPNTTTFLLFYHNYFLWKKKILGNNLSTIATEHWWLNNILHFVFRACTERRNLSWHGAMLFWRLTVKAKNILSIQRYKVRTDRATTHGMLGL